MPRRVTLVLCSPAGRPLGTLPPLEVGSPWWPDVEPVVAAARERFGVDGTVLRLLEATSGRTGGGDGAYLAEVRAQGAPDAALGPRVPGVLRPLGDGDPLLLLAGQEDALRLPWARPGGVAAELAWADARLAEAGVPRPGTAVQVKSWNLSSVLRLPTATGVFWCKSVPPFLAHEGGILVTVARSDPDLVPPVLARRRGPGGTAGTLLVGVPGVEQWEAPLPVLVEMARRWVGAQARWVDRLDELRALGLADWRAQPLMSAVRALVARPDVRITLTGAELAALDALVAALPARLAALAACGLPETLVHGDLHPGNWIRDGERLVLLDWGDSGIGHPLLDLTGFIGRVPGELAPTVLEAWAAAWAEHAPGADPVRALQLIRPVAALRKALVYRTFLDGIEATERGYHAEDVPDMLRLSIAGPILTPS